MTGFRKNIFLIIMILTVLCLAAATGETAAEEAEQGLEEIQPLILMSEVEGTEGMSLEEVTDAFSETAMSEYLDGATGFSMQYPSAFQFDEGGDGTSAITADGKATLNIDNMINEGGLDEDALIAAIRLEIPDAEPKKNQQNGCLRFDRTTDSGTVGQTDLYFLTKNSFHHITLRYPTEEQEIYSSYIEYMINTMGTNETDLG